MPPQADELIIRLARFRQNHLRRDQLVQLVRDMYAQEKGRSVAYLGGDASVWRGKVPSEYWESSNRPQNATDLAAAVLGGHAPQFRVSVPGGGASATAARAEKFLLGVFRANSRRQMADFTRRAVFRTVLDGGTAIRTTWDTHAPEPQIKELVFDDEASEDESPWQVAYYPRGMCPIETRVVPLDYIYTGGPDTQHAPFSELFHVTKRTAEDVMYEWQGVEGAQLEKASAVPEQDRQTQELEYIEWWRQRRGEVEYAVLWDQTFVVRPRPIAYPCIPYVLTCFKELDAEKPHLARLPFIFSILWAVERDEYLRSRLFRLVDMLSNLVPVHRGTQPIQLKGTWGQVMQVGENERIEFPNWPGHSPDVWQLLQDVQRRQSEGTFSSAMYGEVSSRMSGYGLSQLIGADTLRMDTPRANLELAFSAVADQIFGLLGTFSPQHHIAVTARIRGRTLSAMLSGEETKLLVVETVIKAKQSSDEVRLATLGAQLASLPKPPVSTRYILEEFFGMAQPEDEMAQVLEESALNDPIVRLTAMLQVLHDLGSPYAAIVERQLEAALGQAAGGPPAAPTGAEAMAQMGGGMPQAVMGNEPNPLAMAMGEDLVQEAGPTPQTAREGGPTPQ
jgi:hypothetical protein